MHQKLIIVSGFSAAGKGAILAALGPDDGIEIVQSFTTRPKRSSDDFYTFVSYDDFCKLRSNGYFLESNEYSAGHCYGTPLESVMQIINSGRTALFEIDCNGCKQVLKSGYFSKDDICTIYVAADAADLLLRLKKRNTESIPQIIRRLETATIESHSISIYDHLIVNKDLSESKQKLRSILAGEVVTDEFDDAAFRQEAAKIIKRLQNQMKEATP